MSTQACEGEFINAIEKLQQQLNSHYLAAETIMSLRDPKMENLHLTLAKIDLAYEELITNIHRLDDENASTFRENAARNKKEFDAHKNEFLEKRIATSVQELPARDSPSLHRYDIRSHVSTPSARSKVSTSSSVKRKEAEAEFKAAQLRAFQASERAQETLVLQRHQAEIAQREAQRELELASVKLQVWDRDGNEESSGPFKFVQQAPSRFSVTDQRAGPSVIPASPHTSPDIPSIKECSGPSTSTASRAPPGFQTINECPGPSAISSLQPPGISRTSGFQSTTDPVAVLQSVATPNSAPAQAGDHFDQSLSQPMINNSQLTNVRDKRKGVYFSDACVAHDEVSRPRYFAPNDFVSSSAYDLPTAYPSANRATHFNQTQPTSVNYYDVGKPLHQAGANTLMNRTISDQARTNTFLDNPTAHQARANPEPLQIPYSHNYGRIPGSMGFDQSSYIDPQNQTFGPVPRPFFFPRAHQLSYDELFLPRPEFKKFNGNPLEFHSFIANFERHVEPRVSDQKILFCLLLQHCEGKVRDRIDSYTERGDLAYTLAKTKLQSEYGRPCVIADICEQRLKDAPVVKSNDAAGIKSFSECLEKTLITLENLQFFGSLNSLDTITKLVNKLPFEMRRRWVQESVAIEDQTGQIATFNHFVTFVSRQSKELDSLYGRRIFANKSETKSSNLRANKPSYNFAVGFESSECDKTHLPNGCCWFCNGKGHKLYTCATFQKLPVKERSNWVKNKRLCYKCLSSKHTTKECKRTSTCTVSGCTGTYHHTLLHSFISRKSNESTSNESDSASHSAKRMQNDKPECSSNTNAVTCAQASDNVYLCVVPVKVHYKGRTALTYAFLDQGSTHSFCDKKLVTTLGILGQRQDLKLQTLGNPASTHHGLTFSLNVASLEGNTSITLPKVFSLDDIPIRPNLIPAKNTLKEMSHLSDLSFPCLQGASVTLLIGADVPELFCPLSVRKGRRGQPVAIETPLGWSLLGPSLVPSAAGNCSINFVKHQTSDVEQLVQRLWANDFGDGTSVLNRPFSREDRVMLNVLEETVAIKNGHYYLPLPWKSEATTLPDNRELAVRRLSHLKKRLQRDENLRGSYVDTLNEYVKEGYAEVVPRGDVAGSLNWYLPHHPVKHPHKPEKVRVVFDCGAKCKGVSLNDSLMAGPSLTSNLVGVLIRFREERVAVVGDIKSMFHQIRVNPEHVNALKFLWWPAGDLSKEPMDHRMTVHLFGASSSPSCAQYCLRRIARDFGNYHLQASSDVVNNNFYVDDCLLSFQTADQAIAVINDLIRMLQRGGFQLRKFLTNDHEVLEAIPEEERAKNTKNHEFEPTSTHRVLGILWNFTKDVFVFDVTLPVKPPTRRGLLSSISSLFDPLRLMSPVTLTPKLLLQDLCRKNCGWDKALDVEDISCWNKWLQCLPDLKRLRIARCFKPEGFGGVNRIEIHVFSDASSHSYGSCCYLRLSNDSGDHHCCLVIGKSRVAPIKAVTIPRLELTAAVLSVRLYQLVKQELKLGDCRAVFWTDSTSVLKIIHNNTKRFPVFVANRVAIIDEATTINDWRHVPSKLNPADDATRGIQASLLTSSHRWFNGPPFLWGPEEQWPDGLTDLPEVPGELLLNNPFADKVPNFSVQSTRLEDPISWLIDRCSTLSKLKTLIAWILRSKEILLCKIRGKPKPVYAPVLSRNELKFAESEVVKHIQRQHFPFSSGHSFPRSMQKLHPIYVDGVLRVGGRLENADVSYDLKHPVILPKDSRFTELVIQHSHHLLGHAGASHTWANIRSRYWIVKGGAAVRHCIGNCLLCKRRNSPVGKQFMADLPTSRLQVDKPPFSHVGVDYFGPFQVKQGRSLVKRYACVFTCMTVRAIHVEMSISLSTDSFLCALQRFISRRGKPLHIYSDNGTNFVGAARVLRDSLKAFNQTQIHKFLCQRDIDWSFNPPAASHMGGAWERMIRSIRRTLDALVGNQTLTDEALTTLLAEVEGIINSRPLVPVTFDPKSDEPLTPNHLLLMRSNPSLPPGLFEKADCYGKRRWAQIQYIANQFWARWIKEFLPNLNLRQKWFKPQANVEVNDIVLLVDDMQHRSRWQLGRIMKTFPDKKGRIRTVTVKTKLNTFVRPITKLCVIASTKESNTQPNGPSFPSSS